MTYINDAESVAELTRLDHQARLVTQVTGLLPARLEDGDFQMVLDVGCGPGQWGLDMAFQYPLATARGIDSSATMVEYANARARSQNLHNVAFEVNDIFQNELPYAENRFDLIHVRFATGWVKGHTQWVSLLLRLFVLLKAGGYLVITEGEGVYTTSAALERLHEILCNTLHALGYSLSASPRFMGVVARLGHLLSQQGFQQVRLEAHGLDYSSYRQEENVAWLHNFQLLLHESQPVFIRSGATTSEELALLEHQVTIDMFREDFCAIGPLFTFSAQKPQG